MQVPGYSASERDAFCNSRPPAKALLWLLAHQTISNRLVKFAPYRMVKPCFTAHLCAQRLLYNGPMDRLVAIAGSYAAPHDVKIVACHVCPLPPSLRHTESLQLFCCKEMCPIGHFSAHRSECSQAAFEAELREHSNALHFARRLVYYHHMRFCAPIASVPSLEQPVSWFGGQVEKTQKSSTEKFCQCTFDVTSSQSAKGTKQKLIHCEFDGVHNLDVQSKASSIISHHNMASSRMPLDTTIEHTDALGRVMRVSKIDTTQYGWFLDPDDAKLIRLSRIQQATNLETQISPAVQSAASAFDSDGKGGLEPRLSRYIAVCFSLPFLVCQRRSIKQLTE